jgi:hypothetical protein
MAASAPVGSRSLLRDPGPLRRPASRVSGAADTRSIPIRQAPQRGNSVPRPKL